MSLVPVKCKNPYRSVHAGPVVSKFGLKWSLAVCYEDRTCSPGLRIADAQAYQQHFPVVVENARGFHVHETNYRRASTTTRGEDRYHKRRYNGNSNTTRNGFAHAHKPKHKSAQ